MFLLMMKSEWLFNTTCPKRELTEYASTFLQHALNLTSSGFFVCFSRAVRMSAQLEDVWEEQQSIQQNLSRYVVC